MGDEWSIKSLSQTIEDEEEEDLMPTAPAQEDIDMTGPSQDSTSLLADTHGPGESWPDLPRVTLIFHLCLVLPS